MRATIVVVVLLLLAGGWFAYQQFRERAPTPSALDDLSPSADSTAPEPESVVTVTASVAPPEQEAELQLEQEAVTFVETLSEVDPEPVAVERADHFVSGEQTLALLPPEIVEQATVEDLLNDPSLDPDTPITVVRQIQQIETVTPEKLIAESAGDLDKTITVLQNNEPVKITVREVLEAYAEEPNQPISIVKTVRYYQITTPRELAELDLTVQGDDLIGIIRIPYRLEEATIAELLSRENLLDPDAIFYVRTVRDTDVQGIWGIVHGGLISNFSRGVAIRRGEEVDTYRVEIPQLADEVLADKTSSFLGRLIFDKTNRSYVYNFIEHRMGRNPNELNPGQEIVIIKFSADELISIYKHFVANAG